MSEDRPDPRIRELTYQLMGMAPDAPPFPEEVTTMTVPATKQRPPMLVWAAAAAAVGLLVGLPLFLFRGGDTPLDDDVAPTIAAPTSTTVIAPSTTVPMDTTQPSSIVSPPTDCRQDWETLGDRSVDTWYVFYSCDRPGMENILVPVPRGVRTDVGSDARIAMLAQLEGPSEQQRAAGYSSFSVEDSTGLAPIVEKYSGTKSTEFEFADFRFDPGMSNASASAASAQLLAQLSSAAFQFPGVETLSFSFGEDCDAFWNWLQRDCTQIERSEWESGEITAALAIWWQTAFITTPNTTEAPVTTTTLPGEAFDIGPQAGDVIGVVGVAHDDALNVREGPGASYDIVTTLGSLADDVVATGRHRLLTGSIWNEVTANSMTGWVNSRFVGYLGSVDDLTSFIVDRLGGIPEAETMLDLGLLIAESFDSSEGGFRMAVSVAPSVGDLGEVTYDVVGLADDALLGFRLHIFGQPSESGEGFSLKTVEATSFCSRGVTPEGLCV